MALLHNTSHDLPDGLPAVLAKQEGCELISGDHACDLLRSEPRNAKTMPQAIPVSYTHLTLPTICSV
eukprot:4800740-Alexandrium_andersonii.AAC.1